MTDSLPKSRFPRTGTLVLIAVVLLIGGGMLLAWWPYHRNQVAIAEVKRLGGSVEWKIVRPAWIPDVVDNAYLAVFERINIVYFDHTQVSDADLEHLRGLTAIESVWLNNSQVGDVGLVHLRGMTKLETLYLNDTLVSDAGLEHLRGLTNLQLLLLQNTKVTKTGIERLKKALPNCYIEWTPHRNKTAPLTQLSVPHD